MPRNMEVEELNMDIEEFNETYSVNCSGCLNDLCINEEDYEHYKRWISVDTFEMVLIALNIIVFLAGIMGNLLVSIPYFKIDMSYR